MVVPRTVHIESAGFGSTYTWDDEAGGPIGLNIFVGGRDLRDWVANEKINTFTAIVDIGAEVTITMRHLAAYPTPGDKETLTIKLSAAGATVKTITLENMVFASKRLSQQRSTVGEEELVFFHESADGTTSPDAV